MLDQPNLPKDDLNHSVLLDVHTHSDYPEVNVFVHEIHSAHFSGLIGQVRTVALTSCHFAVDMAVETLRDPRSSY